MPTPIQPKPPELMAVTGHEEEEMNAIREEAIKFNIFNLLVWCLIYYERKIPLTGDSSSLPTPTICGRATQFI
jgi:hypothetical protein